MKPQAEFTGLDRLEPALLLTAVAAGLAVTRAVPQAAVLAERILTPALLLLLTAVFYRVPLEHLRTAFGHRRYFLAALGLNFVLTPLLAYGLGWVFLRDERALWLGLILVLVTPCTDWYLVFTTLARGDVALNLALLPWNLLLQLALLPLYLWVFTSALIPHELSAVARSFLLYVAVPFVLAQVARRLASSPAAERSTVVAQYGALTLLIVAVFAQQADVLFSEPRVLLRLMPPLAMFFFLMTLAAMAAGRAANLSAPSRAALACTAVARNSPLTLSLALVLFPVHPQVALTQVVEPLLELPFLVLLAWWLRRRDLGTADEHG
jgi:ACR3 family arsenite efflux pump ArsB